MLVSPAAAVLPQRCHGRDLTGRGKTRPLPRHQQDMRHHLTTARGCSNGPPMDVLAWRRCQLREAGFPLDVADLVAADPRFDLHALLQLVDRGCPPDLAVRIMAPLPRGVES